MTVCLVWAVGSRIGGFHLIFSIVVELGICRSTPDVSCPIATQPVWLACWIDMILLIGLPHLPLRLFRIYGTSVGIIWE